MVMVKQVMDSEGRVFDYVILRNTPFFALTLTLYWRWAGLGVWFICFILEGGLFYMVFCLD